MGLTQTAESMNRLIFFIAPGRLRSSQDINLLLCLPSHLKMISNMMILFKDLYHKETAHMNPIPYKSHNLQGELISWRPREPKVELQSESWQD